ncbi:DUF4258 domain-containing protein [Alkalihalobacillus sp. BA299]|uniref:DUF4258 domain-containing protein n=1 Tax=Alkalihalobacillus sp. BA299 TaxID=2815938 RepID=UPI001ADCC368|nr:DUF4258 domain-containing protein [Alkalihalobacillus sp. BA299]
MEKHKKEIMRDIQKILMNKDGVIRVGKHTKERFVNRGYYRGDIVRCILSGHLCEVQVGWNFRLEKYTPKFVIEGKDLDDNPMVVVLSQEADKFYSVITIMPPHDRKRFKTCI